MTAIATLTEPCWTLVYADGSNVGDIEPHYNSETKAREAIGYYLADEPLTPRRFDGLCSTATLACGYRYDENGECVEHWTSADRLRNHLLGIGYRPGENGTLRCPAGYGCDECDELPDAPDHTPLPGQLALIPEETR